MQKRKLGEFSEEYILQKAVEQYESGQASFKVAAGRTALLVIDMQEEFTRSNWSPNWIPEATKQVPKIKDLIGACRRLRIPIIYTYFAFRPDGMNMAPPLRAGWTPLDKYDDYDGPPLYQKENIDQTLKPNYETDILVSKPCIGAFTGTSLDLILKNLGVDTIVICGTMTNYCCGTTAREAHARGYKVVFGSDVNSTDNPEVHDAELKTLRRGFALVLAKDQIKEALEGKGPYAQSDLTSV